MIYANFFVAIAAAMMLLSTSAAAASNAQAQEGDQECPGSLGAVPASVDINSAGQEASPKNVGIAANPNFEECGVGAVPQTQDERGNGSNDDRGQQ